MNLSCRDLLAGSTVMGIGASFGAAFAAARGDATLNRDKAKTELGTRFDPRFFNDTVVEAGAVPLTVLASVDAHVATARKRAS